MLGTPQLRELLTATTRVGAKTVLVGDAHQLAPVHARGGMFEQLCVDLPWAQRLSAVWRMRDPAERSASLALRDGGPAALRRAVDWYRRHDRLHCGDSVAMAADALAAWRADTHADRDALLVTDTWEVCDALNTRIHDDTIDSDAPTVAAARGHRIGAGDIVISRHNDASIAVYDAADLHKTADPVRNGNRWRVTAVDPTNSRIAARRLGDDARAVFGGEYMREHVHFGYAVTVHAAQGVTADTSHAVLGASATRAAAYVGLTRGRASNSAYLWDKIAGEGDHEHTDIRPGVHVARRGTKRDAAAALRAITGRDERARTVMASAADTDPAQLPEQVRDLLSHHERTRDRCRADYRRYVDERFSNAGYEVAAEVPALRAEIELLAAAGARSPAAMYRIPDEALAHLDDNARRAGIAIAHSAHAIQPLRLGVAADKPRLLAALTAAAHHHQRRILALPATEQAAAYAAAHRYADTTTRPTAARTNFASGRWTLPIGSLVIVDDADHLDPHDVRYLAEHAERTNTKLLLITNDGRESTHTLVAVLNTELPWAQQLGSPRPTPHLTGIQRAEHHAEQHHIEVAALLQRRKALVRHYQQLAEPMTRTRSSDRERSHTRQRDRGYGLER